MNKPRRKREHLILMERVLETIPRLRRQALSLTRNEAEADDLVQDTLVRALTHLDQFQSGTEPGPWLYRILRNTFLNRIRKARTNARLMEKYRHFVERSPEPTPIPDFLLVDRIEEALDDIPEDFRRCVELCDLSEFSYREIAERLDIPIGTVMSRLHRGRRRLQTCLIGTRRARRGTSRRHRRGVAC